MSGTFEEMIRRAADSEAARFRRARLLSALVAIAAVSLLGLSGWFITAASIAGSAGIAVAQSFNYMLPSAAIRFLAIVRTSGRYGERLIGHSAVLRAMATVRVALFSAIVALPARRALAIGRGEAVARIVQDVDRVENGLVRATAPWGGGAAIVTGCLLAGLASPWAALWLFGGSLGYVAAVRRLSVAIGKPGADVLAANGALKEAILTYAQAAPELRCYAMEGVAARELNAQGAAVADIRLGAARSEAWLDFAAGAALPTAAAGAIVIAAPAGPALAALAGLAAAMTIDGLGPLLRFFAERPAVVEARHRLAALTNDEGEVPRTAAPAPASLLDLPTIGLVAAPLLARVVIGGVSGSGKTSLIETLVGLREPLTDEARIGGIDITLLPAETLRAHFAWMPQDALLISGSVRDNLRLAAPHASEVVMWESLVDAAMDKVIRDLPGGLDAWIGVDGERLSAGERRRLALARCYCSNAPMLLLDEPLEGLDLSLRNIVAERLVARLDRTGQGALCVSHTGIFPGFERRTFAMRPDCKIP
jgi:ATP-binding cassette subfamily C protein CydC